jgi:hypothetical protein
MTYSLRVSICVASSITKCLGASLVTNFESSTSGIFGFHPLSSPFPVFDLTSPVYIAFLRASILTVLALGNIDLRPSV